MPVSGAAWVVSDLGGPGQGRLVFVRSSVTLENSRKTEIRNWGSGRGSKFPRARRICAFRYLGEIPDCFNLLGNPVGQTVADLYNTQAGNGHNPEPRDI